MKKIILLVFPFWSFLAYSQVGINTQNPAQMLDVNGSVLTDSYLIDTVNKTLDVTISNDYYLLVRSKDTSPAGKLKILDVAQRNVAPMNLYKVTVNNVDQSQITQLSTDLETSKYTLAIAGAVFKNADSAQNTDGSYGAFYTNIDKITENGKDYYTINLDFAGAGTTGAAKGTWELSLIVFEKVLVKEWGTYTGSVNSSNFSGTSTNTPTALQ